MNINAELKRVEALILQAENIRDRIKVAAENTQNILQACDDLGVPIVGIGKRTDEFKDSKGHPFGAGGSVFADGRSVEYYQVKGVRHQREGWPIAWQIARNAGVSAGCGNSGQHQVKGEFLDGVYRCKDGVWSKDD
jgi:hypothetical protein